MEMSVGRRYSEYPNPFGIHSRSTLKNASMHLTSCAPSNAGSSSRCADPFIRSMFLSGRNMRTLSPSSR